MILDTLSPFHLVALYKRKFFQSTARLFTTNYPLKSVFTMSSTKRSLDEIIEPEENATKSEGNVNIF